MFHPFFENSSKTIQYIGIWILYAVLQTLAFSGLLPLPLWSIAIDSCIHAALFATIAILLWSVIRYGNFDVLSFYQRLLNHFALCALSIAVWLGVGYLCIDALFGSAQNQLMVALLPLRGLIGLLLYLVIIQQFGLQKLQVAPTTARVDEEEATDASSDPTTETETKSIEILERIAVKSGAKIHVVMIPEILYLQADGDYVQIHTTNGKYLKEQTMKYFEQHLPAGQFVRVHRSTIVNIEMISRIELYEKQSQQLTLKNGQQVKTSPSGYKALRAALNL
jgi:hypothetical protein